MHGVDLKFIFLNFNTCPAFHVCINWEYLKAFLYKGVHFIKENDLIV